MLNIVHDFSRLCVESFVDLPIDGSKIIRVLEDLRNICVRPARLMLELVPELIGEASFL